jgi:hypothetical protein
MNQPKRADILEKRVGPVFTYDRMAQRSNAVPASLFRWLDYSGGQSPEANRSDHVLADTKIYHRLLFIGE